MSFQHAIQPGLGRLRRPLLVLAAAVLPSISVPQSAGDPEPWRIAGGRMEGILGGRVRIDSVVIEHGSLRATGLEGIWDPTAQLLSLQGDVQISDTSRVLHSDFAVYHRRTRVLDMRGNVAGRGPEGRIGGDHLVYDRSGGSALVTGGAWLEDEQYRVEADTLDYDDLRKRSDARGEVRVLAISDSTRVHGNHAVLDQERDLLEMTADPPGRPTLTRPGPDGGVPLVVVADTLRMERATRDAEARGAVSLKQGDLSATGGLARFFSDRNRMELLMEPSARDRDGIISGDTLRLMMENGEPRRLLVLGNASAQYLPADRPGEETFALGDTMVAHFRDRRLSLLDTRSAAQSLFVPSIQDRRQDVGANWSQARNIRVGFENGQATRVEMEGDAEGSYTFPVDRARADTALVAPDVDSLLALPRRRSEGDPLHPSLDARRRLLSERNLREPDSLLALSGFDPAERVQYKGEKITFLIPEDRMALEEGGEVQYQGMALEARSIQFNSLRETVVSTGDPVLRDEDSEVHGERMTYRLDTRKGVVFEGRTEFENGFYRGREIKKLSDNVLYAKNAAFTTCDLDTAHFSFWSRAVKIQVKDKAVARPVVLRLGNIPLLAIPYWIFPLQTGRRSGFLLPEVEFGFDESRGRFLRNVGYYFALSDYMDLLTWGDYYENGPRFVSNARYRYRVRYLLSGDAFGSYSRDRNPDGSRDERWDFRANHEQTLAEDLTLKVRADFVSDATYRGDRDFGAGVDERLNRRLKSNVDLRKRWTWGSLSATVDRTENLDETTSTGTKVSLLAPSIDFSPTTFTLGRAPSADGTGGRLPMLSSTYLRTGFGLRNVRTDYFDGRTETNTAARQTISVTDNRRLAGAINVAPSFNATIAGFAEDNLGDRNEIGAVWSTAVSANSTLYGTFFPGLWRLSGLRHVIEPSLSYRYQPEFESLSFVDSAGVRRGRFPSVGGIGLGGSEVSSISFGMTQRFHLKWRTGEEDGEKKIDNLILWTTGTGFNFLTDTWSSLENSIRLSPARFFESRLSFSYDIERGKRTRLGLQSNLRLSGRGLEAGGVPEYGEFGEAGVRGNSDPGDEAPAGTTGGPWRLSLTHNYNIGESSSSKRSDMNLSASLSLTPNWRVTYSFYYDLIDREMKSQGFTLYRDLHCWEARLERRSSGRTSQFYFRINVKEIYDVKYERR